ncbi:MAG: serine kinase [Sphingomonadales bacterium]|nr:serine kinase [Sphingomonadales bacterium]
MIGPPPLPHQATAVAIAGRALMIEGPPGAGKSSLALALIDRGAVLVGDDSLLLATGSGRLLARPHPRTRGLLELRNLGLLPYPACEEAPVALLLTLDPQAPRFIEQADSATRAGIAIPQVRLWPGSPVLALRAEAALRHYGRG